MRKLTTFALSLSALLFMAAPASAGRGASHASIQAAIRTQNADTIISEIERAERLVCGGCIETVMALLDHPDYRVREVAAWWFARRPAQKAEIHERSVARLAGSDATLALYAADVLGTFRHPAAIPALAQAAARRDFPAATRAAAVRALGTIGDPSAEAAIVGVLGDASPEVRLAAVRAYYELRGARSGAPLVALVADADLEVRRAATAVLGSYRLASARAAFETALASDPDPIVRRNAAWALGRIGEAASRGVLEAAAASDPSSLVRGVARAAIRSLR